MGIVSRTVVTEHDAESLYEIQKSVKELQEVVPSEKVDLGPLVKSIQELRKAAENINIEKKNVRAWNTTRY